MKISPTAQEAIATARFIRMSPTKARQVVDLIRGRHVDDARRVLAFTPRAASQPVGKVLESAIANAEHNRQLPVDELVVVRTWVDEGPTLRRFRPRAMGRATRIRKRTCHISVVVGRPEEVTAPRARPETKKDTKKTTGRKKTTRKSTESKKTTERKKTTRKTTAKKTTGETKTSAKKTSTRKKTTRRKEGS
ncbi:MAG: 50S ribosomal protein L22 [Actinomycetota bacterium]|nr:50S ribosomal protein L22 [Actinomycetota bacterium]